MVASRYRRVKVELFRLTRDVWRSTRHALFVLFRKGMLGAITRFNRIRVDVYTLMITIYLAVSITYFTVPVIAPGSHAGDLPIDSVDVSYFFYQYRVGVVQSIVTGSGLAIGAIALTATNKLLSLFPPYYDEVKAQKLQIRKDKIWSALLLWLILVAAYVLLRYHFMIAVMYPEQQPSSVLNLIVESESKLVNLMLDIYPEFILNAADREVSSGIIVPGGLFALLLWRVSHGLVVYTERL